MIRKEHNEFTRVQLPAALHLTRLGYDYLSATSEDIKTETIQPISFYQFLSDSFNIQ